MMTERRPRKSKADNNARPDRRWNALKHGAFAETVVLPGDNPQDVLKIHQALVEEWRPEGITEHDAVWTLAKVFYRKSRIARLFKTPQPDFRLDSADGEAQECLAREINELSISDRWYKQFDTSDFTELPPPEMPSEIRDPLVDNLRALLSFSDGLLEMHGVNCVKWGLLMLPAHIVEHLNKAVPIQEYENVDDPRYKAALKREVDTVLIPEARKQLRATLPTTVRVLGYVGDEVRETLFAAITLEERLDAIADKAVKRLVQTRMLKQIAVGDAVRRLPAP